MIRTMAAWLVLVEMANSMSCNRTKNPIYVLTHNLERVDASQNQGCLNHKHSIQAVENSACRGESVKLGTEAHYWEKL